MKLLINIFNWFKKACTHNVCDSCGFTKDAVYVTEHFTEAGYIQCVKCITAEAHKELDQTIKVYRFKL